MNLSYGFVASAAFHAVVFTFPLVSTYKVGEQIFPVTLLVSERQDYTEEGKNEASPKPSASKPKILKKRQATDVPSYRLERSANPIIPSGPIDTHVTTAVEPAPNTNLFAVETPVARATPILGVEEPALSGVSAGINGPGSGAESSGGRDEGGPPPVRHAYLPPDYAHNPIPEYPERARRQGWEGTVLLDVLINQEGSPQKIEIRQSSGFEILDRAAFKAVMVWRFVPPRYGETALDGWVRVPIVFRLNEEKIDR